MTDPVFDRCVLCGRSGHCSASCPNSKLRDDSAADKASAKALRAAIRPTSVAADTAARLVADIYSPSPSCGIH